MSMKERFELVYYIIFMILGIGGFVVGMYDFLFKMYTYDVYEKYFTYFGIAFLMTLARFIYNGKHFWNPPAPYEKPSIKMIVMFVLISIFLVYRLL